MTKVNESHRSKRRIKSIPDRFALMTIGLFLLSMIHISLGLVGVLCYLGPWVTYLKHRNQRWCQQYCPRASFLTATLAHISRRRQPPVWLTQTRIKRGLLIYMGANLFFASMSTLMVALGRMEPLDHLRLFMVIQSPIPWPQLLKWALPAAVMHGSYRVISMLFSSTVIGFVLGYLYLPRTWCTICPVMTLTSSKQKAVV